MDLIALCDAHRSRGDDRHHRRRTAPIAAKPAEITKMIHGKPKTAPHNGNGVSTSQSMVPLILAMANR